MCKSCDLAQAFADLATAKGHTTDTLAKASVKLIAAIIAEQSKGSDVQAAVLIEFIADKMTTIVAGMMEGVKEDIAISEANEMLDNVVKSQPRRLH